MRISINTPEIYALRMEVEKKFGCPMRAPRHFSALSFDIAETVKGEYLSETTLQRLWQYKSGYDSTAIHTLNVLCQYIDVSDWEAFCKLQKDTSKSESEMDLSNGINVSTLDVGTKIRIGWMPDRMCVIQYLGDYRFKAIETRNSKLCAGDVFTCVHMQLGREMCLDNLVRNSSDMNYVIGTRNGLTTLEIVAG